MEPQEAAYEPDVVLAWMRSVVITSADQKFRALIGLFGQPESPINQFPNIRDALVVRKNYKLFYYLEQKGFLTFKAFEAMYETKTEGTTERIFDGRYQVTWQRYRNYIIQNMEAEFRRLELTEFLAWSKLVAKVYLAMYAKTYPHWPEPGATQLIKFACAGCLKLDDDRMNVTKELAYAFDAAGSEVERDSMYHIQVPLGIKYILLTYDNDVLAVIENDLETHERLALDFYKQHALSMSDELRQFLTG